MDTSAETHKEKSVDKLVDSMRQSLMTTHSQIKAEALRAEAALKGMFVTDIFTKLNLMKYR